MQTRIKSIIQSFAVSGSHLAATRLEERRVKCLNIFNLILILWLLSMGTIRFTMGNMVVSVLDWSLALVCLGAYYWHKFNLKGPRILLISLAQTAFASQIILTMIGPFSPQQHLHASLIVLSFLILIFFDGYVRSLFYSFNTLIFYGPYFFMEEFPVISILHGTYLLFVPLLVVKCFIKEVQFYENELSIQQEKLESQSKILKQNDRLKSHFFTNITHEFRTPLTLLLGPLKEIKETEAIKNPHNLYLIEKHTTKLLVLVNQILDLSKAKFGFKRLNLSYSNISVYIKSLCSIFESYAKGKGIAFTGSFPEQDINGFADMESLDKILSNLISNAIKFSEKGNKIKVTLRLMHEEYRWIDVQVMDTGKGIDGKELDFIFDQYYHSRTGSEVSTGIGLALVKELVDNHKGEIRVSSELGVGTRFKLKIAIDEQFYVDHHAGYDILKKEERLQYPNKNHYCLNEFGYPEKVEAKQSYVSPITILLVEDNEDMRRYIQQILSKVYRLITAKDGQEGIDTAKREIPDIIISDVMMPVKCGIELTKELKQNITTSHIPIILLTAKFNPESKVEGYQADADDFIAKPFDKKELLCRINNLVRIRKQLQQKHNDSCTFLAHEIRELSIEETFIKKLTEIIFDNIDNSNFSVEHFAKEMGLSRSQLYRKIYALTGLSISQFIRSNKLKYAYQLLEKNVGTVAEIAYKVGFSSPNYFNKCFKEMFGSNPGEVRCGKAVSPKVAVKQD